MAVKSSPSTADRIHALIVPLDQLVADLEYRWGVARLPSLVSAETLLRFRQARVMFRDAVIDRDLGEVDRLVPMMMRAWQALEREATERGHAQLAPEVWETQLEDGTILAVVRTTAEATRVAKDRKGLEIWTMEEIARVVASQRLLGAIKQEFGGATILPFPTAATRDRLLPTGWAEDFSNDDPLAPPVEPLEGGEGVSAGVGAGEEETASSEPVEAS